ASYQQGGRARLAQEGLARNKRRSGFTREAPRGRRSVSQALQGLWRTHLTANTLSNQFLPNSNNQPQKQSGEA
ncbi:MULTISPECIES: hypothetical protein, partial [unclassified Pseudomonas]|uniref:hypothetical protein n=1 Tax=unclassified Pseudomonas TaxID=196821 RepID=UPI003FA2454A